MLIRRRIRLLSGLAFLGTGLAVLASAQVATPSPNGTSTSTPQTLILLAAPEFVFAGNAVTITASGSFDPIMARFDWFQDGVPLTVLSGVGRSSITLTTPDQGALNVGVVAAPSGGLPLREAITITPLPNPQKTLNDLKSDFTLEASATNPDPDTAITVAVQSFTFDKARAKYSWFVNGTLQIEASGVGRPEFSLSSGREGTAKTVRVDVTTPSGISRSQTLTIRPVRAVLYWWSDTQVPYWYKGKALPSIGSRLSIFAAPAAVESAQLDYRWELDVNLQPQASGLGKSVFAFKVAVPFDITVEAAMKNLTGTFAKTAGARIRPVDPIMLIYAVRPPRGIVSERSLRTFTAPSGDPYEFIAAPFFLPFAGERTLAYTWNLNGKDIAGEPPDPWRFILTSNPNTSALDQLSVAVESSTQPAQQAVGNITIDLH